MSLQNIEEKWKDAGSLFTKKFAKHDENWHHGQTYRFENDLVAKDNNGYFQFKTIIEKRNQDYFIYDEVIRRKDKLFFVSRLHDDKKGKVWELIIHFENNEIIEQIRHLSYKQFFNEVENNEELIKKEAKNTTIIKTPVLDFIINIANKEQENISEESQEKY